LMAIHLTRKRKWSWVLPLKSGTAGSLVNKNIN
jgi:hypothetical protein